MPNNYTSESSYCKFYISENYVQSNLEQQNSTCTQNLKFKSNLPFNSTHLSVLQCIQDFSHICRILKFASINT